MSPTPPAAARPEQRPPRSVVISVLGVTQILAWGSSYYLPAVLAAPIAADTGWSIAWVIGGLSCGLLLAGLVSPFVGTAIERHGGRPVLVASAMFLAVGQLGLALSDTLIAYLIAWLAVGLGMAAGLYDAAFGTLGRLYGREARSAITTLTLFGGFASTVCWPISAFLLDHIGWRGTVLAYSGLQLLVALPLYFFILPTALSHPRHSGPEIPAADRAKPSIAALTLLALTLTLAAFLSSTLSVHLLGILQARGLGLSAAVALGAIIGPFQVGARAIEFALARWHHPIWTKAASATAVSMGIGLLALGGPIAPALALYGAGIGLESIARGTLPLALFGPRGYAGLMGRLGLPILLLQAAAPSIGAVLLQNGGVQLTLTALSAIAVANVVLVFGLVAITRTSRRTIPG